VPDVLNLDWLTDEQREQLERELLRPYPVLYSISDDNTDEGGGPLYLDTNGALDDSERFPYAGDNEVGDIWFMLDAWPEAIFTDEDLGIEVDPFGVDEPWEDEPADEGSEAGDGEVEVAQDQGQADEDQATQDQP